MRRWVGRVLVGRVLVGRVLVGRVLVGRVLGRVGVGGERALSRKRRKVQRLLRAHLHTPCPRGTTFAMAMRLTPDRQIPQTQIRSKQTRPKQIPRRQIHLDFHTGPDVPDVGRDFDAQEFARTMLDAHVNSVTLFAKCHHGHLYYNTHRPERHPGLRADLNLLGEQVEALHRVGIRAPIYLSVQCDEYAANTYPQWIARKANGEQVKIGGEGVFQAGWQILDMATDYQDFLAEQTLEVLRTFKPVDGLFFDMCWDQPSMTAPFMQQMKEKNLNPESEADRKTYARHLALAYMQRFFNLVKSENPKAGCHFNSRPLDFLAGEINSYEQVEIESLPTGGWGYMYFPRNVRFARTFGLPYLGMTARFHKSWADFGGLKPHAALEYETRQMLAHGASCSIGDQLHPRGRLDAAVYDLIGKVYSDVESLEPWLVDAVPLVQIGVLQAGVAAEDGATRMLSQLKQQFDIIGHDADFSKYELLVLPDAVAVDGALSDRLSQFIDAGGSILASGFSGLSADGKQLTFAPLGIEPLGVSPFTTTYLRFGKGIDAHVPDTDHVMYEPGVRIRASGKTMPFGHVVEPYFERTWEHFSSHFQTPGAIDTPYPIATLNHAGNGRVGFIPFPIFTAFGKHGNYPYRLLVANLLQHLLPAPLITSNAPTGAEITVLTQGEKTIVHVLYYSAERRTKELDMIEEIIPLHEIKISLKLDQPPTSATLVPSQQPLDIDWNDGRATVTIAKVEGHAVVVFE